MISQRPEKLRGGVWRGERGRQAGEGFAHVNQVGLRVTPGLNRS